MKVKDMPLSRYYHKYLIIEADVLTEVCSRFVKVEENDCFALCSAYCNDEGKLLFHILAIGSSPSECTKGLSQMNMLGTLRMLDVKECEAECIEPNEKAVIKNDTFLKQIKEDEDLTAARLDWRLDDIRDLFYPDIIPVGIISNGSLTEYKAKVCSVSGPFLKCRLLEDTKEHNLRKNTALYAFPYMDEESDTCRLYAMFTSGTMSTEEEQAFHRIMHVSEKYGITFNGTQMKS